MVNDKHNTRIDTQKVDGILIAYSKSKMLVLAFILFNIHTTLCSDLNVTSSNAGSVFQPDISCVLIRSNGDETFLVGDDNKLPDIDIYLHPNKIPPKVRCTLISSIKDPSKLGKLSFRIKYSQSSVEEFANFTNFSDENTFKAEISIADNSLVPEHDILPFEIGILLQNRTRILVKGTIFHLEMLPTFSLNLEYARFMEANHSREQWKFLPTVCNRDILLMIPKEVDNHKHGISGIPVATVYGNDSLKLVKWEHVPLPIMNSSSVWSSMLLKHFLLLHSKTDVLLIQSVQDQFHGNATRNLKDELDWGSDISEILSISVSKECTTTNNSNWYDMVIVFRFFNTAIGAMLSSDPYWNWDLYVFPDWLKPALYLTSQLEDQMRMLIILVSIGEPLSSAVLIYKIKSDVKELKLHAVPFIFPSKLDAPMLELIPSIPALVVYSQNEVWLSADGGQYFNKIFKAEENNKIQRVAGTGVLQRNLAIVSENNVYVYSSRGIYKSNDLSSIGCLNASLLWRVSNQGSVKVYCNASFLNSTLVSATLNFTLVDQVFSSFFAEMRSEFEISMHLPDVYLTVPEFVQSLRSLCLIPRYPFINSCEIDLMHDKTSLLLSTGSKIQAETLNGCLLHMHSINSTKYIIHAVNTEETSTPCKGLSEAVIGQSLQIPNLQVVCWIYWLLNTTTAEASCSPQQHKSETITLIQGEWMLLDSRGSERCFKANVILNGTSASSFISLQVNLATSYLENATFIRLSETVGKIVNNAVPLTIKLFSDAPKLTFDYICIINQQNQKSDVIEKVSSYAQICHFNVTSENTIESKVFLDANEQLKFNITLTKLTNMPYWDKVSPISIELSDREHVLLQVKTYLNVSTRRINLFVTQKPYRNGITILKIQTPVQPTHCNDIIPKVTIYGTCAPHKRLLFEYPIVFSRDTWLFRNPKDKDGHERIATLPYNYQPPSIMGKAIPMTSHIYNADPSKQMYRARYKITRKLAKFKQCKGKLNRLECGCTDDKTFSSSPFDSDCIQRVYRVDYHETFQPHLYILDAKSTKTSLAFPYRITEVNNRTDYEIINDVGENLMSVPAKSCLEFTASGLYHFKINVVKSRYTFCDLEAYFVIFVADEPLPDPAQDLVRAITSFCFGSVLFSVFLVHYYHPNRK